MGTACNGGEEPEEGDGMKLDARLESGCVMSSVGVERDTMGDPVPLNISKKLSTPLAGRARKKRMTRNPLDEKGSKDGETT